MLENRRKVRQDEKVMSGPMLYPDSAFSRAVFKVIRPHIPRERWPADAVRARFEPGQDGLWLEADFDNFPSSFAALAAQLVREAGVDLVLKSPMATAASAVVRAKRWRDVCLYGFLPLMFAIPLMASLSEAAMRFAFFLFCGDLIGLALFNTLLTRRRAKLREARFIAHVPAPGLKINLSGREGSLLSEPMPEV